MENHVLSIERMQHLRELGLDTSKASMCWVIDCNYANHLKIRDLFAYKATDEKVIPSFTLQDILEMLPYKIKSYFLILLKDKYAFREGNCYNIYYRNVRERKSLIKIRRDSLLDAAYEMLCWCVENGYIKTK